MGTVKLEYERAATPRNDRGIPGNCTRGVITSASWRPVMHQYLSTVGNRATSNEQRRRPPGREQSGAYDNWHANLSGYLLRNRRIDVHVGGRGANRDDEAVPGRQVVTLLSRPGALPALGRIDSHEAARGEFRRRSPPRVLVQRPTVSLQIAQHPIGIFGIFGVDGITFVFTLGSGVDAGDEVSRSSRQVGAAHRIEAGVTGSSTWMTYPERTASVR